MNSVTGVGSADPQWTAWDPTWHRPRRHTCTADHCAGTT